MRVDAEQMTLYINIFILKDSLLQSAYKLTLHRVSDDRREEHTCDPVTRSSIKTQGIFIDMHGISDLHTRAQIETLSIEHDHPSAENAIHAT